MKKLLFVFLLSPFLGNSQLLLKLTAFESSIRVRTDGDNWTKWIEKDTSNVLIVRDYYNSTITSYGKEKQEFKIIKADPKDSTTTYSIYVFECRDPKNKQCFAIMKYPVDEEKHPYILMIYYDNYALNFKLHKYIETKQL